LLLIIGLSSASFVYDDQILLEVTEREKSLVHHYYYMNDRSISEETKNMLLKKISDQERGCGYFSGNLSLEVPAGADRSGFVHLRGPVSRVLNLTSYDGIELRIKTDGRLYLAQIKPESHNDLFIRADEEDLFQVIIPPIKPHTWTRIILPFSDFISTWRGYQREQDVLLDQSKIKNVSFLMAERESGPFYFYIDWIHAVKFDGTDRYLPYRYKGESVVIPSKDDLFKASQIIQKHRSRRE